MKIIISVEKRSNWWKAPFPRLVVSILKILSLSLCIQFLLRTPDPATGRRIYLSLLRRAQLSRFFFRSPEAQRHLKCRKSSSSPHSSDVITDSPRCSTEGGRQRLCAQVWYSTAKVEMHLAVQYLPLLLLSLQHLIEEIIFTRKYWNPFPLQGYHSPGLRGSENPARAPPSTWKLNYTLQTKDVLKWYVPLNVAVQNKPAHQPLWGITDVREQPNIHETVPTISPQQKSHSSALTLGNPLKGSWGMQRRNWKTEKIGRILHCLHTTHLPVA